MRVNRAISMITLMGGRRASPVAIALRRGDVQPAHVEALKNDRDECVGSTAAEALAKIGPTSKGDVREFTHSMRSNRRTPP